MVIGGATVDYGWVDPIIDDFYPTSFDREWPTLDTGKLVWWINGDIIPQKNIDFDNTKFRWYQHFYQFEQYQQNVGGIDNDDFYETCEDGSTYIYYNGFPILLDEVIESPDDRDVIVLELAIKGIDYFKWPPYPTGISILWLIRESRIIQWTNLSASVSGIFSDCTINNTDLGKYEQHGNIGQYALHTIDIGEVNHYWLADFCDKNQEEHSNNSKQFSLGVRIIRTA